MTRPGARLVHLWVALVALALVIALTGAPETVLTWAVAGAIAFAGIDLVASRRGLVTGVTRAIDPNVPVNRSIPVRLTVHHSAVRQTPVTLFERLPEHVIAEDAPGELKLVPRHSLQVSYRIRATGRGDMELGPIEILEPSPLRLWGRRRRLPCTSHVRVYPDFAVIAAYLELASERHAGRLGIKLVQKRGEGLEFHQLREYREGDPPRAVDWKATARRRRLIAREYQDERDQRVLFLLDTGRRMRSRDGELTHFDHALNALLLLAYVALRQGDEVSLLAFGGDELWLPPMRGVPAVNRLLNAVYRLDAHTVASDYVEAAEEAMARQRKRALVVLLTNLREEDDDLGLALDGLRRRHVVLLADLREMALQRMLEREIGSFDDALRYAGTVAYLSRRSELHRRLRSRAHVLLDCAPQELPVQLVNSYWQIKRSGAL